MRRRLLTFAGMFAVGFAPAPLGAKGDTVRISIEGGDLVSPVQITEAAAAGFQVWSGPGTSSDEQRSFVIDWSRGAVKRPQQGLPVYDVSFVTTRRNPGTYVIQYAIDTSTD